MATTDPTFVKFTDAQAAQYAEGRSFSYPKPLYDAILDYHQGPRDVYMDIGTGPGKVLFDLAPNFTHSIGTDTSAGMIRAATAAIPTRTSPQANPPTFLVGAGETCDTELASTGHAKADLITVAMAAHWMQMPAFYAAAARALRPGGTLAIWTCSSLYVHPGEAEAEKLQAVLTEFEDGALAPYHNSGTKITRAEYRTLGLPWTVEPSVEEFGEGDFVRKDWDVGGVPSSAPGPGGKPGPFLKTERVTVAQLEMGLATASSVIRYREANPEKALGEEDAVLATGKRLREILKGREGFVLSPSTHLLLMRRK